MLLKYYTKGLLTDHQKEKSSRFSSVLRGLILRLNGKFGEERLKALEYHAGNHPAQDRTGFIGYIDSVHPAGTGALEARGWLVHLDKPILSLTFFGTQGAAMGDYGFARPDLIQLFPQLPQVGLSGFRVILQRTSIASEGRLTFQALLSNLEIRYGSFPIDKFRAIPN